MSVDSLTIAPESMPRHLNWVFRIGYVRAGVNPKKWETVARHATRMKDAALALDAYNGQADMNYTHDWPEIFDFPSNSIPKWLKHRFERQTLWFVTRNMPNKEYIRGLWMEYEDDKTPRAIIGHDQDKLELTVTSLEYEGDGYKAHRFAHLYEYATLKIKTPELREVNTQLLSRKFDLRDTREVYHSMLHNINLHSKKGMHRETNYLPQQRSA